MNRKSLKEIAWNVDEITYRADNALSHSLLSTYARGGHKALRQFYYEKKKLETRSLGFGSLLDTLVTNPGEFDKLYLVGDFVMPSEKMKLVIDKIVEKSPGMDSLAAVPFDVMLTAYDSVFQNNWKPDTKINKIMEEGNEYFSFLEQKGSRILVPSTDYFNALECREALVNCPFTRQFFESNDKDVELFCQLKFKINMRGNPLQWKDSLIEEDTFRVMLDVVLVDHANKVVVPVDLKTTSKDEEDFETSIIEYRYDIQAGSYRDVLTTVLATDDYFKRFTIGNFCFACINREHKKPVTWEFVPVHADTCTINGIQLRDCDWKKLYWKVKNELSTGNPDYSVETLTRQRRVCNFNTI